jgi:hypothetical protein
LTRNPWSDLPLKAPYVLPVDEPAISRFNARAHPENALRLELIPEPFLGRPDAPVVLLNLNPGFDNREVPLHSSDPVFIDLSRKNLSHGVSDCPFYLLHPLASASLGQSWWKTKLREPILQVGLETVARNLLCVEYFPYHSRRFAGVRLTLASQLYSFDLVRSAIARGALIVVMRGGRSWLAAVPELATYPRIHKLNSVQNVSISRGNCPLGYEEIVRALSS